MKILPVSMINYYSTTNVTPNVKPQQNYNSFVLKADTVSFTGGIKPDLKKIVILLGAPNSGKGTFARKIAQKFSIPQISTGDILRSEVKMNSALGQEAKSFMQSGGLVPDSLIMKIFKRRISQNDCKKGFILDGFPRTINQAKELDKVLEADKNHSLKIVNLDVSKPILYSRSASRYTCADCSRTYSIKENYNPKTSKCECGGKLIKRIDDTPEVLTERLANYEKQTKPLIDFYGDKVSTISLEKEMPVEVTFEKIVKNIDN